MQSRGEGWLGVELVTFKGVQGEGWCQEILNVDILKFCHSSAIDHRRSVRRGGPILM